jgi:hypothetical protein
MALKKVKAELVEIKVSVVLEKPVVVIKLRTGNEG